MSSLFFLTNVAAYIYSSFHPLRSAMTFSLDNYVSLKFNITDMLFERTLLELLSKPGNLERLYRDFIEISIALNNM